MADRSTMHTLRADMVMLGDDVARLEQSAIDEGSMFEMGYFAALGEMMEQLQTWEDMSGVRKERDHTSNTTSLRYWH